MLVFKIFIFLRIEIFNQYLLLNYLKKLKWNNSYVKILKKVNSFISLVLSEFINQAFYDGIYPSSLKLAKVIPIFKSGLKTLPGNYRPISLLSYLNEIIEKVIYTQVYNFFYK